MSMLDRGSAPSYLSRVRGYAIATVAFASLIASVALARVNNAPPVSAVETNSSAASIATSSQSWKHAPLVNHHRLSAAPGSQREDAGRPWFGLAPTNTGSRSFRSGVIWQHAESRTFGAFGLGRDGEPQRVLVGVQSPKLIGWTRGTIPELEAIGPHASPSWIFAAGDFRSLSTEHPLSGSLLHTGSSRITSTSAGLIYAVDSDHSTMAAVYPPGVGEATLRPASLSEVNITFTITSQMEIISAPPYATIVIAGYSLPSGSFPNGFGSFSGEEPPSPVQVAEVLSIGTNPQSSPSAFAFELAGFSTDPGAGTLVSLGTPYGTLSGGNYLYDSSTGEAVWSWTEPVGLGTGVYQFTAILEL